MKPVGCAIVWVTACALAGCGGSRNSSGDKPSTSEGGGGNDVTTAHAGAETGGEGATGPMVSDDQAGGAGGGGGGADLGDYPEETLPLSRADVVRIAGTSFTTPAEPGGPTCDDGTGGPPPPQLDYLQLAFVANAAGGIDVIASTRGPWLNIQRSQLLRTRSGYVVEPPPPTAGCMVYYFEDSYRPAWPTPKRLALRFAGKDEHSQVTSMSVSADFDSEDGAQTLTTAGARDVNAPSIAESEPWVYDSMDKSYYLEDDVPTWRLPRHFDFTEALLPGWSVALENDAGDHFEVARSNGVALAPGFDVVQFFPPGFHWVITGRDFAGNVLEASSTYRSELPAVDSGSFETDDRWRACDPAIDQELESCVGAAVPGHADLPALAGTRSLFIGSGRVTLRIARTSGATKLLFIGRLTGSTWLRSDIQALDAGSSARTSRLIESWPLDAASTSGQPPLSLPQEVSIKLPPGSEDVLLSLAAGSAIWLDAVHTE